MTEINVVSLSREIINNDFYIVLGWIADEHPGWAKNNRMTKEDLVLCKDRIEMFDTMREAVCECMTGIFKKITGGFILEDNERYPDGNVECIKDGHLSLKDLVTELIIDCLEPSLEDESLYLPCDDRTGDDGEAPIYGSVFGEIEYRIYTRLHRVLQTVQDGFTIIYE